MFRHCYNRIGAWALRYSRNKSTTAANHKDFEQFSVEELISRLKIFTPSKKQILRMKRIRQGHQPSNMSILDQTYQRMLFLEGHRLVLEGLESNLCPSDVFISDKAMTSPLGKQLIGALVMLQGKNGKNVLNTNENIPRVFWVKPDVIGMIADTCTDQGVCASFLHTDVPLLTDDNILSSLVVCDNISDAGNLGTIIRSSYGMGVNGVVTINGCSPWVSYCLVGDIVIAHF